MERLILFGTGYYGKKILRYLKDKDNQIICFADNNEKLWGTLIDGVPIVPPSSILERSFDAIVICVSDKYYSEIYRQLCSDLMIDAKKIRHWTYWQRKVLLEYYKKVEYLNTGEKDVIKRLQETDRLRVFNFDFTEERKEQAECKFDDSCEMFYGFYCGRKIYLKKSFDTKAKAKEYSDYLVMEQDDKSPHRYLDDSFTFDGGVLLDAGAAEGNFSLEIIEKADKVILLEADRQWNEALHKTFEPWKDKVVIINKYLGNKDDSSHITIDSLSKEYDLSFIKMDIEGAEVDAIEGARKYIKSQKKLKMAICVYHNNDDEKKIRNILVPLGLHVTTTQGYMIFIENMNQPPRLVHGVLRVEKS